MGKVLVLYDSATGHTQKMAEEVAQGAREVPGIQVRLRSVDEASAEDIFWCDGLAVGTPTNLGVMSWKMKRFWDEVVDEVWSKVDGKIACAFSSSGGWGGGAELACLSTLIMLMNYGFLVFGVPDYVARRFTLHYGAVLAGEPRQEEEIASCRRLGQRLAEWVAVFVDGRKELHPVLTRQP
ncbi:MAG: flavodoxin domain-containing protein [Anaerolineae bacterium]|nr:flavodoxin domain-containing protein [Anaerolineae bacterium]MDW8100665.1 flavodoxin domain-containing protein [Anaerolineae bacterium]